MQAVIIVIIDNCDKSEVIEIDRKLRTVETNICRRCTTSSRKWVGANSSLQILQFHWVNDVYMIIAAYW